MPKLRAELSVRKPNFDELTYTRGATVNAITTDGPTVLCVSHSLPVDVDFAKTDYKATIELDLPPDEYPVNESDGTIAIRTSAHAISVMTCHAIGAAGASCMCNVGQAAMPLIDMVREGHGHSSFTYGPWQAPYASIAWSKVSVTTDDGNIVLRPIVAASKVDETWQQSVDLFWDYVRTAVKTRQTYLYEQAPTLSKPFAASTVGYTSIGAMTNRTSGMGLRALESFFKFELETMMRSGTDSDEELREFMTDTEKPGEDANTWTNTAVAALRNIIVACTGYRSDGNVVTLPDGNVVFMNSENWFRARTKWQVITQNDCDGSALLAMWIIYDLGINRPASEVYDADGSIPAFKDFPYLQRVHNALYDYVPMLSVLTAHAASGDEVTKSKKTDGGAGDPPAAESPPLNLAGHALTILMPISKFIESNARGERLQGVSDEIVTNRQNIRHGICYPEQKLAACGDAARELRSTHLKAMEFEALNTLETVACEGTVLAKVTLHHTDDSYADEAIERHERVKRVMRRMGPTLASGVFDLASIGTRKKHTFYERVVEGTTNVGFDKSQALRAQGCAANQFVFMPSKSLFDDLGHVASGVTPTELCQTDIASVPLVPMNEDMAQSLDAIEEITALNTLSDAPPGTFVVTEKQTEQLERSLAHAAEFQTQLKSKFVDDNATVKLEFHISPRDLLNNPMAVKITLERIESIAVHGELHIGKLDNGFAQKRNGDSATYALIFVIYANDEQQ